MLKLEFSTLFDNVRLIPVVLMVKKEPKGGLDNTQVDFSVMVFSARLLLLGNIESN